MSSGQESGSSTNTSSIIGSLTDGLKTVVRSRYLYIGIVTLALGMGLNFASQTYLHNYMSEGKTLPMLSDLILDNIPYMDVAFYYDVGSLLSVFAVVMYIVVKKEVKRFPYFLILIGIFYIVRGIFIVLTPFGNPPLFNGTGAPFNGFSKYELGVYPSGHVGNAVIFFLLARDKFFKWLLLAIVIFIIITLLLARGHYSIDIFSGWFFAYAIITFGEKYLKSFDLSESKVPS
jgi:membrane-associated phospholipid phosphatase